MYAAPKAVNHKRSDREGIEAREVKEDMRETVQATSASQYVQSSEAQS